MVYIFVYNGSHHSIYTVNTCAIKQGDSVCEVIHVLCFDCTFMLSVDLTIRQVVFDSTDVK